MKRRSGIGVVHTYADDEHKPGSVDQRWSGCGMQGAVRFGLVGLMGVFSGQTSGRGSRERVVLVHGMWMNGLEMGLLQQRVRACGFECHRFSYPSMKLTPAQSAVALDGFLQRLGSGTTHLVAHSLGGIVLMHLFNRFPHQQPGRVVLLGAPVCGSAVAGRLARAGVLSKMLGRNTEAGLLGDVPKWRGGRALGVIAGTQPLGLGRLVGGLEQPSDGTVAVAETRVCGASAHLLLPVTHTGLLFSSRTARATCRFLRCGTFEAA